MSLDLKTVAELYESLTMRLSRDLEEDETPNALVIGMLTASMVIAEGLESLSGSSNGMDRLDHSICMGIRHGLFGGHAPDDANLSDVLQTIADSIAGREDDGS